MSEVFNNWKRKVHTPHHRKIAISDDRLACSLDAHVNHEGQVGPFTLQVRGITIEQVQTYDMASIVKQYIHHLIDNGEEGLLTDITNTLKGEQND